MVGVPAETSTNVIMSRFVEQAMTSLVISLFFLTQISFSWVASTLGMGFRLIYVALGVSLLMTMLLLMLLIWPHFIGRVAMMLERTRLGRLVGRVSGKHNWAPSLHRWSHRLRENVRTLWAKKTWVMVLDILMGIVNILLHAWSLQFVLEGVVGVKLSFVAVVITYVILWQVVFYVPTPGRQRQRGGRLRRGVRGHDERPQLDGCCDFRLALRHLLHAPLVRRAGVRGARSVGERHRPSRPGDGVKPGVS